MKLYKAIFFGVLILGLGGCKSFKVLYNWSAEDQEGIEGKKILVVARTTEVEARQAFEKEVTEFLRAAGQDATASYVAYPDFDPGQRITKEEGGQIERILKENGYNAVVMTVLKDYQEDTRTMVDSGYEASVNYGYIDRPTYLGWGFYTYFYHPLSYSTEDILVEQNTVDTITSKLYVLDSMAFNLDLEEDKQMVRLFRASIENPEDAVSTARSYAKAIAKTVDGS